MGIIDLVLSPNGGKITGTAVFPLPTRERLLTARICFRSMNNRRPSSSSTIPLSSLPREDLECRHNSRRACHAYNESDTREVEVFNITPHSANQRNRLVSRHTIGLERLLAATSHRLLQAPTSLVRDQRLIPDSARKNLQSTPHPQISMALLRTFSVRVVWLPRDGSKL